MSACCFYKAHEESFVQEQQLHLLKQSDLLMCWASFNRSPVASDLSTLSLPARSTKWRHPRKIPPVARSVPFTWTVNTLHKLQNSMSHWSLYLFFLKYAYRCEVMCILILNPKYLWDRLLRSFNAVEPTALFLCPIAMSSRTSSVQFTGSKLASGTFNPFCWELFLISSVDRSQRKWSLHRE